MRKLRTLVALATVPVLTLGTVGVAYADTVENNVGSSGIKTIAPGGTTTISYEIIVEGKGTDGEGGCNATISSPATVNLEVPANVTASRTSMRFTGCKEKEEVTFSATVPGDYNIRVASVVDLGLGSYTNLADFVLTVTQPSNTKPSVAVAGVTHGASYEIGSALSPTCNVTDAQDGPSSFAAAVSGTLSHGLGQLTATCNYTDTGGLAADTKTATYTIVDTGAPTIGHALSPAGGPDGSNGWYRTDVTVTFECADAGGSGIESCVADGESGPSITLSDGADQSVSGTATDWAGNTATDTVSGIDVDSIAPGISYTLEPVAPNGSNGWYTSGVTVTFECSDAGGSGIDTCLAGSGPGDLVTLLDGEDQVVTGTATDLAGNTTSVTTEEISVDTGDPTITHTLDPAGPNGNGWYNEEVTVTFGCSDAGSGIESCVADGEAGDSVTLGEGADQSVSGTATDRAGNTATDTASDIDIDTTAPTLTPSYLPAASYVFGSVPAAPSCSAEDVLSGEDGCTVTGGGTSVGPHTWTATAKDRAGNETVAEYGYTVQAWTLTGFYQPVDMNGVWNTVKGGSTVPLKFEVFAGGVEQTGIAAVKGFAVKGVACPATGVTTDDIELLSTGGTSLRYAGTDGQFIQNWQTPKKPGVCYQVTVTTLDDSSKSALFKLK